MKTALIATTLAVVCATISFAADTTPSKKGQGMTLEQKKTEILQHIQDRIAKSQAEISCVKSAASHDELRACREKFRPQPPRDGNERRDQGQMQ